MHDLTQLKRNLFEAYLSLDETPNWKDFAALTRAALSIGQDATLPKILFMGDPDTALLELNKHIDTKILESFDQGTLSSLKVSQKVQGALEKKVLFFAEHPQKTLSILKYLRHPMRAPLVLRLQAETLNAIWYFAGDQATDYNYYTKRFLLGYIYKTTFIFWLRNRRKPIEKTINFMKNRFKEVGKIPKIRSFFVNYCKKLSPFAS